MSRGNRARIKDKRRALFNTFDRQLELCKGIDDIADGQSELIEKTMPHVVTAITMARELVEKLTSGY